MRLRRIMSKKVVKQSLLIGILTSSFGIFLSKALGLIYYSPLSALAGESNMSFYSITYTYYDQLLKISSAGIPFAIAALTARYYAKEDYKTVLLVRKLGTSVVMALSMVIALGFLLLSGPLARQSMGALASEQDIANLKTLFLILIFAVVLVPYLSATRGYYQGLKRLDLYASSQVLEQFVRVFSILLFGYIFVRVFNFDSIWAIFVAMAAAGIAALLTIFYLKHFTRNDDRHVEELVREQDTEAESYKTILIELLSLGVPYLVISFLGSVSALVNTSYFIKEATASGMPFEQAKLSLGILQANCAKLSSIPQVLTLGFSSGLVPYLTESYQKGDDEKIAMQITQIIDTCLFILIPVILIFVVFSRDIYFIMYGNHNLDLGSSLFRINCIVTFTDTVAPILSSIMITLMQRKNAILVLLASGVIKLLSFKPLVASFGAGGMVYSTVLANGFVLLAYLIQLTRTFSIDYKKTLRRVVQTLISTAAMLLPAFGIHSLLHLSYLSRLKDIIVMGALGLLMLIIYFIVSSLFRLPQQILGITDITPRALIQRLRK